jgi:hypothetical protein
MPLPPSDPILSYVQSLAGTARNPTTNVGASTAYRGNERNQVYLRQSGTTILALDTLLPSAMNGAEPTLRWVGIFQQ